jgi:hypothetical protein
MFLSAYMGQYAAGLSADSAFGVQGLNQSRLALANSASPQFGQAEVASLQAQDKALELDGIRSQTNYQVAQAMAETANNLKKKEAERRANSGSIFG